MIKFHTYGDSHASKHGSWDRVNLDEVNIVINWLGPKTMYSFGRDKEMIIKRNEIGDNDFVCFCFGEIDCRAHINKYEPGEPYKISKPMPFIRPNNLPRI